ncbi:ATP-binding protein [Parafrankia sp. EUN1f]|uniref:sensor histidine kinase n=1 Tax=Parafrankia sp. EUN1f TaxID=102897 RepID=UPI0001C4515E|nr:ATP-binding protein [Parafrankia sp. EUN1f]EFC84419.1 histidine kinase [Parafrankia sp. EUN1f]
MPLRVRLTLLFALGTSLVLVAAGVLFYLLLRNDLQNSVDASLRTRFSILAAQLPEASDPEAELKEAGAGPAQLLRADGTVIASTDVAGSAPLLDRDQVAAARTGMTSLTLEMEQRRGTDTEEQDVRALAGPLPSAPLPSAPLPTAPPRTTPRQTVLVVATETDLVDAAEDRIRNIMIAAMAPTVALAGLAAWLLSGAALRPVDRMRRQTAAISESDSAAELDVPATRDEIAALATTMNDLLRRLNAARARDRAFVADAGHELRTPLTNLKAELDLAGRPGRTRDDLVEAVGNAAEETDRLIRLAESMLTLARMDSGIVIPRRLSVGDLLDRASRAAAGHAQTRDVTIRTDADRTLTVDAEPDLLRQAVDNLLANAIRHAPPGTAVEVRAHPAEGGAAVAVQVRDHGPGFPPDFLPHAFERFRRSDSARTRDHGGTGLGLAIVAATAHAHHGTATASNHPDGGAVVAVTLPTSQPPDVGIPDSGTLDSGTLDSGTLDPGTDDPETDESSA